MFFLKYFSIADLCLNSHGLFAVDAVKSNNSLLVAYTGPTISSMFRYPELNNPKPQYESRLWLFQIATVSFHLPFLLVIIWHFDKFWSFWIL